MHNGFLQVEGEKMSKSLGNFVTINELRQLWKGHPWPGEALRFNMLRTHYRDPIDWTFDGLDESHKILWDWAGVLEAEKGTSYDPPHASVLDALSDDLNTPQMITELHALRRKGDMGALRASLNFLGISGKRKPLQRNTVFEVVPGHLSLSGQSVEVATSARRNLNRDTSQPETPLPLLDAQIKEKIDARNEARKAKNFKESDRIRDELLAKGIVLKDGPTGTTWEVKR
jgi:cysteinyl-tRNA synthetase